jgi:alpha-mannosidase
MGKNPDFKFNWADTNFLAKFYEESNSTIQEQLHTAVKNGQLNFMGGGWVMNDETVADYQSMLLQQYTGLRWLNKTFGVHPRVAWQIDPFGASAVSPALFSTLGYEAVVLARIGTTA